MKRRTLVPALVLFMCVFARAVPLRAQTDTAGYATRAPTWVAQFTTLSANAVLGGLTAGIIQELRGGSFKDGFVRGSLGGAIIYGGKRITAERFFGAGFVGREVAAVGSSVVRNASDGVGNFDRLILPAGFMRVYWQRNTAPALSKARTGSGLQVKVDAYSTGLVVYGMLDDHLDLDAHNSLSSGAVVFKTNNEVITYGSQQNHAGGISRGGVILRSDVPGFGEEFLDRALAHERAHVAQDDQLFITLTDRLDDWVWTKLGPLQPLSRYVDLNPSSEFLRLLTYGIPRYGDRPWELEAIYLTK